MRNLFALIVIGLAIGLKSEIFAQNLQHFWEASQTSQVNGSWTTTPIAGLALLLAFGSAIIGPLFSSDAWNNVTYVAGEMLDWEAPTGGYLLTACFATGRAAGQGVLSRFGL